MHENIVRIKAIANILQELEQAIVFVGGATVSLYATSLSIASGIRPTEDVDIVIELASYDNYSLFEDKLRLLGFTNDKESGVICRYRIDGMIVDFMPTTSDILGFSNIWYPEGFANAIKHSIDEQTEILIFTLPYFIASKWEAHKSRGGGDLRTSSDFEDIVYVFENARNFDEQLGDAPVSVKDYLINELLPLLDRSDFEEALYCHMDTARYGANVSGIIERIKSALS